MPLRQRLAALAALAAFAGVSHAAPTAPSRLIVKFGEGDVEAAFSPITRVAHMAEGFTGWKAAGMPVEAVEARKP